jgi:hypothetical protein
VVSWIVVVIHGDVVLEIERDAVGPTVASRGGGTMSDRGGDG